jgi:HTH-type transcriptional regulator, competence development regulator
MSEKTEKAYRAELKSLGKKVRALRKSRGAKGLSQLDLEVKSGINRSDISKIENGKLNIEFYTIAAWPWP